MKPHWQLSTKDLTKFSYRQDIKVELFKNLAIFWLPLGTYSKNLTNLGTFFS
jgi:hypothetical protein